MKSDAHPQLVGFYRRLDDLAVRSPLATPVLAQALTSDGRGRALGVSALFRRELARGTLGWLTYTLARSERPLGKTPLYASVNAEFAGLLNETRNDLAPDTNLDLGVNRFDFMPQIRFPFVPTDVSSSQEREAKLAHAAPPWRGPSSAANPAMTTA